MTHYLQEEKIPTHQTHTKKPKGGRNIALAASDVRNHRVNPNSKKFASEYSEKYGLIAALRK